MCCSQGSSGSRHKSRLPASQQLAFFRAGATPHPMDLMRLKREIQARLPDLATSAYGLCLGNLMLGGTGCRYREEQIRISR